MCGRVDVCHMVSAMVSGMVSTMVKSIVGFSHISHVHSVIRMFVCA